MTGAQPVAARAAGGNGSGGGPGPGLAIGGDAVTPVRDALIGAAVRRAGEVRAAARADAAATLAAAGRQAAEILAQARARGELDGQSAAAVRCGASRRAARRAVLAAQREVYEEVRRRVREAVVALRDDPVYPRLHDRLEEIARDVTGPSATVTDHPAGGVVAEGPGTFADCSLPRLADRAVDKLGPGVSVLWAA